MPYAPEYLHLVLPGTKFEALLYGRNSVDPTKAGYSVDEQLANGRSLCQRHNWPIADEFKDTGISASRHGRKTRDDFEELLDVIETGPARPGVTRIVVAFEASRYYRDLEAYVRLRNACLSAGVLLCYNGQVYDLSRRDDRKATAMHAIDAEDEVEGIRERNLRTAQATADAGRPHGPLRYGYTRDYEVVNGRLRCVRQYEHPVQGPYVLQSFVHMDTGGTLKSLVRWLRSEKEAARPDGSEWTEVHARRMLLNRTYLGERVHHGVWRKATWDPIKGLDTPAGRAMFNRVTAKLTDPERRTQRGSEVAHLLSLIALCGHCGDHALLEGTPSHTGVRYLRCREKKDVTIREDWMDAYVEEAVINWFSDKKQAYAALVPDDGAVEEKVAEAQRMINGYEEQLREARALAETFDRETGRPMLSVASLASMEQKLEPKLEAERKKLQEFTGASPLLLSMLEAEDPDAVWNGQPPSEDGPGSPGLSLEQKREVIRTVVTVRLHKARKAGVRKLEPGRIRLSFVGEAGFRDRPLRVPGTSRAQGPAGEPASGT
jgi:DNA invertase Pin-like site-specific DNA recombinase